jgi:hypothetical protein
VLLTNPRAATEPAEALTTAILSSNPKAISDRSRR